ncbi:DUF664 domain-containing protein [Streptomyces sp. NPDC047002]|uniref:mycothiol transferase n=1 Tax=Streptomyces sp. NPDC047002 TaxID=3155475 RepID=UPI00345183A0
MPASSDLLIDGFGRIREVVHEAVDGLGPEELATRLDDDANSITWLVWHLTRVQDDHVADAAGSEQVWTADGWSDRFELPFEPAATGYGHSSRDVGAVSGVSADLLTGYHEAVHDRTVAYLRTLGDDDFERVVDDAWTPAVTLRVRLVSVLSDDLQHAGQAAFIRGALERR